MGLSHKHFGEVWIWFKIHLLDKAPLCHPRASVRSNNIISDPFLLCRGTRQGCPLSPLLFAIAIEPLAIALRTDSEIQGMFRAGLEQKISLYADDLV